MFSGNIATARLTLDDIDRALERRHTGGRIRRAARSNFRRARLAGLSIFAAVAVVAGCLVV